jgi:hypothetical protein
VREQATATAPVLGSAQRALQVELVHGAVAGLGLQRGFLGLAAGVFGQVEEFNVGFSDYRLGLLVGGAQLELLVMEASLSSSSICSGLLWVSWSASITRPHEGHTWFRPLVVSLQAGHLPISSCCSGLASLMRSFSAAGMGGGSASGSNATACSKRCIVASISSSPPRLVLQALEVLYQAGL